MVWELTERWETSAGTVAAGRCGSGPDLVLAHGWPWSSLTWRALIPVLARTHTVHWYDMPGYGASAKAPEQATGLDVQGEIFAEMLVHWGLRRPAVVAHDFGGATTLRAHLLHGCEYDRLILMNIVAMRPWGSAFFAHVGRHVEAFTGLPDHIHEAVVRAYIGGALVNALSDDDLNGLVAPWLGDEGRSSFYRQFAQADERFTVEIEPLLGAMRCPVSILWGEDDPWIPISRGRALHDLMPDSKFMPLAGVGHLPQMEAPKVVLTNLLPLL
mgnify:CR=1 FL=1